MQGKSAMTTVSAAPKALDIAAIRAQFPALSRRHQGHPVAYFDGPGGTQVPTSVAEAMTDYLYHHNANTHWAFPTSVETDAAILGARGAMADFLGANPDEIAFGANMTTLTFHLARALGRGWGAGDEIVITELDHHANVAPWEALARERAVTLRVIPFDPRTFELDFVALEAALTPKVKLLAIGAASNALGTVTDVTREDGAQRGHPLFRRRRALRRPRPSQCQSHRLRLPRLLGIQVLWAPYRNSLWEEGPDNGSGRAQTATGAQHFA